MSTYAAHRSMGSVGYVGRSHPSAAQVRIRRTVALLVLATAALIAVFVLGRVSSHASTPTVGEKPATPRVVTVMPGDTLWSIATKVAPNADPRTEIALIRELNGLTTASVQVGQRLTLPN